MMKINLVILLVLICIFPLRHLAAQEIQNTLPGVEGEVHALLESGPYLYVGGQITSAGGVPAGAVVRHNLETGLWEDLGLDCRPDCTVTSLAKENGFLYVAGNLTVPVESSQDETEERAYSLAQFDIENGIWDYLGDPLFRHETAGAWPGTVADMVVADEVLFVAGNFHSAGEVSLGHIAGFNLTSGSWFSPGDGATRPINALAIRDNILYVGTSLASGSHVGGSLEVTGIATLDLSVVASGNDAWSIFGDISLEFLELPADINSIHIHQNRLFIGGIFDQVNGVFARSFADYDFDLDQWKTYPDGRFDVVDHIDVLGEYVYIVTPDNIDTEDRIPTILRSRFNDDQSDWDPFALEVFDGSVLAMVSDGEHIFTGGTFTRVSTQSSTGAVAGYHAGQNRWFTLGTYWTEEDIGLTGGDMLAGELFGGRLYAGGGFTGSNGESLNRIGVYNPAQESWMPLGDGFADHTVRTIQADSTHVYAGGDFTLLENGQEAAKIARFSRSTGSWEPLGAGVTADDGIAAVHTLLRMDNSLFVGGEFNEAGGVDARNIARYDITTESWHAVGEGTNGPVFVIHPVNDQLFLGGSFDQAGGVQANGIVRYHLEGEEWSSLDDGVEHADGDAVVYAVESFHHAKLFLGGSFTSAGGMQAANFAIYDLNNDSWVTGSDGTNDPGGTIYAMKQYGDNLFIGGEFTGAGAAEHAQNIVRYNHIHNEWFDMSDGTDGTVFTLEAFGDELFTGGSFSRPASRFARWTGVSGFEGGSGTENDPFLVGSSAALNRVGYFYDAHFLQTADVHFSGGASGYPLASPEVPFQGVYDGNGKAITNWNYVIRIDDPRPRTYIGLFRSTLGARLTDIHLVNVRIRAGGGAEFTGGLAGYARDTEISHSSVSGQVRGDENVGGLSGAISGDSRIEHSYYTHSPGLNFSLTGNVSGIRNVGGLVGWQQGGMIRDAFAHGSVQALGNAENIGGFVGFITDGGEIHTSYSITELTGNLEESAPGGFAGLVDGGHIQSSYWNTDMANVSDDLIAEGLSTVQMKNAASFDFDFESVWDIREGTTLPFLRSENTVGGVGPASRGTVVAGGPVVEGEEGWRYFGIAFNRSYSYADFTRNITTQGFFGANIPTGVSNVYNFSNDQNDWRSISSLTPGSVHPESNPFAIYVFPPPLDTAVHVEPVISMYRNVQDEAATPVHGFELNQIDANDSEPPSGGYWTLMANNNLWPVTFNEFEMSGIREVVYVYDPSLPGYISWNGQSGDLTDGIILPFQGFFMETLEENADFSIPAEALVTESPEVSNRFSGLPSLRLGITSGEGYTSSVWVGFNDGNPVRNAHKLRPRDFKPFAELAIEKDGKLFDIANFPVGTESPIHLPLHINMYRTQEHEWISVSDEFLVEWSGLEQFPDSWELTLHDPENGIYIDLRSRSSFTFRTESDDGHNTHKIPNGMSGSPDGPVRSSTSDVGSGLQLVISPSSEAEKTPAAEIPDRVTLDQNYPNPFNPNTNIRFGLPEGGDVTLRVYDVLGRNVATLLDQNMTAGYHTVSFDGSLLASGMYIYRLELPGSVMNRTMMLIK